MTDEAWALVPFIGLSATPWTAGLGRHYDDLIIAATTAELIESGYLSPFRVFAPSHPDLSAVRTVAGDFHEGDLGEVMSEGTLVADVVDDGIRSQYSSRIRADASATQAEQTDVVLIDEARCRARHPVAARDGLRVSRGKLA